MANIKIDRKFKRWQIKNDKVEGAYLVELYI